MSLLDIPKDTKFEQATITSVDKLTGRVGLFLRNGLESVGTYLYDVKDLRVGLTVVVAKVNNFYTIVNEITSDSVRKSYSTSVGTTVSKPPGSCIGTIGHTFPDEFMETSSSQWFYINAGTIKPHTRYVWSLVGPGFLSFADNHQVMYNSPSYTSESTIILSLEDGTICDSFTVESQSPICYATIGYTTQQMTVNGTQTLTVVDPEEGRTYNWAVSGGGSLSANTGLSVVYTAPVTNPNCSLNPTITLTMVGGGNVCDTLELAVNGYTPGALAGRKTLECNQVPYSVGQTYCGYTCTASYCFTCADVGFACNGDFHSYINSYSGGNNPLTGYYSVYYWHGVYCGGVKQTIDQRSEFAKVGGCCPQQLL